MTGAVAQCNSLDQFLYCAPLRLPYQWYTTFPALRRKYTQPILQVVHWIQVAQRTTCSIPYMYLQRSVRRVVFHCIAGAVAQNTKIYLETQHCATTPAIQ